MAHALKPYSSWRLFRLNIMKWLLFAFFLAPKDPIPLPDHIELYRKMGCVATRVTEPAGNTSWHVMGKLEGEGLPTWEHLIAIREQRAPALSDCDRWMKEIEQRSKKRK